MAELEYSIADASSTASEKDVATALLIWNLVSQRRARYAPNVRHGMPFTTGFLVLHAKAIRKPMGEHRASAAIRELRRRRVLIPEGFYRSKRHGYRVTVYGLAAVLSSVRRKPVVKPRKLIARGRGWWWHPLFGEPDGLPPPLVDKKTRERWKSKSYRQMEMERMRRQHGRE